MAEKSSPSSPGAPGAPTAQIAYSYTFRYLLDADRIAEAQARHVALCRRLGPARCLVLESNLERGEDAGVASTKLVVDARLAATLETQLDSAVSGAGGEQVGRSVAAEDVTKQLVDTGARVRAKQALADRLSALIGNARGNVADLVAAEKAYADVQEELDAARTLETTLRRRVAMSTIDIAYSAEAAGGTLGPVGYALRGAGDSFAASLAAAITFVIAALPWLAIAALALFGIRPAWRRWRARRRERAPAA